MSRDLGHNFSTLKIVPENTTAFETKGLRGECPELPLPYWAKALAYHHLVRVKCHQFTPLIAGIFIILMADSANAACSPPDCAPPEGWDNFANNLASDLAPLLTLLGEQVTTQYLSESLSWIDSLLFALAPLGIITAMVAAIRVAGTPLLRSLIGRAKESRGTVEAALMSSTSSDVCELWNGEGVVRVLGSPVLLQLVHLDLEEDFEQESEKQIVNDSAGIYLFREAIKLNLYKRKGYIDSATDPDSSGDADADSDIENLLARQNPPNLSLNVSIKPLDQRVIISFVALGFLLQVGVLVFSAITQYYLKLPKDNATVAAYGFPVFCAGTLILAVGMFLCAQAVETSTKEVTWESTEKGGSKSIIWLQQGGQTVGDQRFEPFARRSGNSSPENRIITSEKAVKKVERAEEPTARSSLVTAAVSFSLIGFVAQFIGLRAMHPSVIVAQLGAVLIMTVLRSCAHIQREDRNDIQYPDEVEGYELDWLAKYLKECESWEVITGADALPVQSSTRSAIYTPLPDPGSNAAMAVMKTRARLARLSSDWELESRKKVEIIHSIIERTMGEVFASMALDDDLKDSFTFEWAVPVKASFKDTKMNGGPVKPYHINLKLSRTRDENSNWRAWKTEKSELEAVLCLWISSLTEVSRARAKDRKPHLKQVRLLGPANQATKVDYRLWIHRGTTPEQTVLDPGAARYFGWSRGSSGGDSTSVEYLCVDAEGELETLCAQELYAIFLFELVSRIKGVGGNTALRTDDSTTGTTVIPRDNDWAQFRLSNSNLASLATIYNESGLGTTEEAYFCIVPAFSAMEKLPYPHEAYSEARRASERLGKEGKWDKAAEIDSWLYDNSRATNAPPRDIKTIRMEVRNRLLKLSQRLAKSITKDANESDNIEKIWDTVYSQRQVLSTSRGSEDRPFVLVTLCMTFKRAKPGVDVKEIVELVCETIQSLRTQKVHITTIFKDKVRKALNAGSILETDSFVRFLWANTIPRDAGSIKKDDHLASKLLFNARRTADDFLCTDKLKSYLSNTESLRSAAETKAETGVSAHEISDGQTPVDLLLIRGFRTPLQMAAEVNHEETVKKLLQAGADVNAKAATHLGRTALQAAVEAGNEVVMKQLLKAGASINAPPAEYSGRTALQAAAGAGHEEILKQLLANKANVNAEPASTLGRTALQAAAEGGYGSVVELLLRAKAHINAAPAPHSGLTALQAAAVGGHIEIVQLLLKRAPVPAPHPGDSDSRGMADDAYKGTTKLLSEADPDPNIDFDTGTDVDAHSDTHSDTHSDAHSDARSDAHSGADFRADVNTAPAPYSGLTALQAAASGGYKEIIKILLEENASVNAAPAPHSGVTSLQAAARSGNKEVVALLLKANADVNAEPAPHFGVTALQVAARGGHKEIVELLLTAKASVNAAPATYSGVTALQAAAEGDHKEVVELLLAAGADVNALPATESGRTALQAAAENGHEELIEQLLASNADVNAPPAKAFGRTALQAAVESSHKNIVKALLAVNADVNAAPAEESGRTALELAVDSGDTEIFELLLAGNFDLEAALDIALERGYDEVTVKLLAMGDVNSQRGEDLSTPLYRAIKLGHDATARQLLARKDVDVNLANIDGCTPLYVAALYNREEMTQRLLDRKEIDVSLTDTRGRAPLSIAVREGHQAIFRQLIARNDVDASLANKEGLTPLIIAAWKGHEEIAQQLLARGDVDVNLADKTGRSPLFVAVNHGNEGVFQQLLSRKGVDVNLADKDGWTPLNIAAFKGHEEIARQLLAREDVDINLPDNIGRTPLYTATQYANRGIVKQLLAKKQVQVNRADKDGWTALNVAAWKGRARITRLLLSREDVDINLADNIGRSPLYIAAREGHKDVSKQLLARKEVKVNFREYGEGWTPLYRAVLSQKEEVVRQLLAREDVDADLTDSIGRSPLYIAVREGYDEIIKQLLARKDVDINRFEIIERWTLLYRAVMSGKEPAVRELLAREDLNVNLTDSIGRSPLYIAARDGHDEIVKQLLTRKDIDVNLAEPGEGWTPLYRAVKSGRVAVVRQLLARKDLNVNLTDNVGRSPLYIAAQDGRPLIVQHLLARKDVDLSLTDKSGRTALSVARERHHQKIVAELIDRGD